MACSSSERDSHRKTGRSGLLFAVPPFNDRASVDVLGCDESIVEQVAELVQLHPVLKMDYFVSGFFANRLAGR